MLEIARRLKPKYRLVILMNAGNEDGKQKAELVKVTFDKVYNSAEMGVAKPDPMAFKTVLKDQKAKPEECLFIDNHPGFIEAARTLGIRSILFKNIKSLKKDLADFFPN